MANKDFRAFTTKSLGGILRVLANECQVCAAFTSGHAPAPYQKFVAIWDTGATHSVITQDVVTTCGLKPTGMKQVHHAGGVSPANTYLVNILLPNGVAFEKLEVTLGSLPPGAHMLIGMDIISVGDFSVTNVGGKTVFSFRYPSIKTVDYAEEARRIRAGAPSPQPFYKGFGKKKHR